MEVVWSQKAFSHLRGIHKWLGTLENANAPQTMRRIRDTCDRLESLGDIGRPGQAKATRELSVRLAPYVMIYSLQDDTATILGLYHMSQGQRGG
jgi:plasmid stabilization system protein ParE